MLHQIIQLGQPPVPDPGRSRAVEALQDHPRGRALDPDHAHAHALVPGNILQVITLISLKQNRISV